MVFHLTQDFRKLSWHDGKPSWVELNFPSTTSLKSRKTLFRGEVSQSSSILGVERVCGGKHTFAYMCVICYSTLLFMWSHFKASHPSLSMYNSSIPNVCVNKSAGCRSAYITLQLFNISWSLAIDNLVGKEGNCKC